ncbi:carbohydrate ABC transporter permease [Paenibacillaceae bacterium WGS1546]|uniref:carbohydrate ABC transporter permease n=1 Tax=Cohnella sp. WGS1546 TaxID=3366810 RepID=UPI00372D0BDE
MVHYRSTSRTIFEICNYTFLFLLCVSILVPFLNAIAISLSSYAEVAQGRIGIWPRGFNLDGYKRLVLNEAFLRSAANTVFLTVVNTVLVILISLFAAFALANKNMIGKKVVFNYFLVTMFFNGGMIPTYLVVNSLGITNTYFALILPAVCNVFYVIVFKNVIDQLPKDLMESAEMDGAGELSVLARIVLPLVLPMTAAFTIFSAVAYWNEWFGVLIYIRDKELWTLQYHLRDILADTISINDIAREAMIQGQDRIHPENIKMSALMITVLPIVAVYPFVQKYFIHGQLVGAVKG